MRSVGWYVLRIFCQPVNNLNSYLNAAYYHNNKFKLVVLLCSLVLSIYVVELCAGYDKLITAIERIIHLYNMYLLLSAMVKLATIKYYYYT